MKKSVMKILFLLMTLLAASFNLQAGEAYFYCSCNCYSEEANPEIGSEYIYCDESLYKIDENGNEKVVKVLKKKAHEAYFGPPWELSKFFLINDLKKGCKETIRENHPECK